jgi:hypothetical protein
MIVRRWAAVLYAILSAAVCVFQLALAAGAPWGAYAMRGAVSGSFSVGLRVAEVVQAVVIVLLAGVVLSRADLAPPWWRRASRWAVWIAVALGAVSLVLNLATPSGGERSVWAPIAFLMLVSGVVVAAGKPARKGAIAPT